MKRLLILFPLFALALLTACGTGGPGSPDSGQAAPPSRSALTITDGSIATVYSAEDLQKLATSEATFRDVTYIGVPLKVLLEDAGFDPQQIKAVKASALDGFSANLEQALVLLDDTLVAFARVDGPLAGDELPFRLVLPDQGGSLNVRMLTELRVIP